MIKQKNEILKNSSNIKNTRSFKYRKSIIFTSDYIILEKIEFEYKVREYINITNQIEEIIKNNENSITLEEYKNKQTSIPLEVSRGTNKLKN